MFPVPLRHDPFPSGTRRRWSGPRGRPDSDHRHPTDALTGVLVERTRDGVGTGPRTTGSGGSGSRTTGEPPSTSGGQPPAGSGVRRASGHRVCGGLVCLICSPPHERRSLWGSSYGGRDGTGTGRPDTRRGRLGSMVAEGPVRGKGWEGPGSQPPLRVGWDK